MKPPILLSSREHLFEFGTIFRAVLKHSNFFICPSAMTYTAVYQDEIKIWRGDLFGSSADLDVWLRIAKLHSIGIIPLPLMRYRISDNQWTARVRIQTERADFFRVTDYYLAQSEVRALLDSCDLRNYGRLERRDRVMRAVNLFLLGRTAEICGLLDDIYSFDSLKAAVQSKRGLGVQAVGIYLRLLILFGLDKFGQTSLRTMKRVMHK